MKHVFVIYNFAGIPREELVSLVTGLSEEFTQWAYKIYEENSTDYDVCISILDDNNYPQDYESKSIIAISDDSICHNEAPYGSGNDIWKLGSHVDVILIAGKNPDFTQFSIRTPLFKLNKINYVKLVAALVNQNC